MNGATVDELKKIILETKNELIFESSFSRVMHMLQGTVSSVNTIGFITGQNPGGQSTSIEFNNRANVALFNDLKALGYGPIKIRGSFGSPEKSFLVPNVTRTDIVDLGNKYNQLAVIWGQKSEEGFGFEYIEGGNTIQKRDAVLTGTHPLEDVETYETKMTDVQDRGDFYSQIKGRKFLIPFFDSNWEVDATAIKEQIENNKHIDSLIVEIQQREKLLNKAGMVPKYYWHHRNILKVQHERLENAIKQHIINM